MLFIYTIIYFILTYFYFINQNIIASCLGITLAIFLYIIEVKNTKRIINARGMFALSFIGAFSISLLKLSNNSSQYSFMMMITIFISYFSLYIGTYAYTKHKKNNVIYVYNNCKKMRKSKFTKGQLLVIILIFITFVSFLCEAFILKFIPFFTRNTPHAYSTFHVFIVHYITMFSAFIPPIAICNYEVSSDKTSDKNNDKVFIIISFIYVIVMSLLLISRTLLMKSTIISIIILVIYQNKKLLDIINFDNILKIKNKMKLFIIFIFTLVAFIILYVCITFLRAHNSEYLNDIFDMKMNLPLFISQPYIYLTVGFENLNYMIQNLFRLTFGRRMLIPFFTLTFIKKFFPIIADSPTYILKTELSTLTLIYDAYYDFALIGVIVFCFILGFVGKMIEDSCYENITFINIKKNNYIVLLFALFCYYMFLSFFQTFFSLTDTWVNIIFILGLMIFFVQDRSNDI